MSEIEKCYKAFVAGVVAKKNGDSCVAPKEINVKHCPLWYIGFDAADKDLAEGNGINLEDINCVK